MRAMILAAGLGERMGALTQNTPKPLLKVGTHYLIEYAIFALVKINIHEIIINISYQKEKIKSALGDGKRYGARFYYSEEIEPLETGGGIFQALNILGHDPFIVLSSDVITDYPLKKLLLPPDKLAHLILVDNPTYHPEGDFNLKNNIIYLKNTHNSYTFGNIGLYHPDLFKTCTSGKFRLGDLLKTYITSSKITGEYYSGLWHNLGTIEDLNKVNAVIDSINL